jgi:hypothetical protein
MEKVVGETRLDISIPLDVDRNTRGVTGSGIVLRNELFFQLAIATRYRNTHGVFLILLIRSLGSGRRPVMK